MSRPVDSPLTRQAAKGSTPSLHGTWGSARLSSAHATRPGCQQEPLKALGLLRLPAEALEVQEAPVGELETSEPGGLPGGCTEQACNPACVLQVMCSTPLAT